MSKWIKIKPGCELPKKDEWVQVYDDESTNPQDTFWANLFKRPLKRSVVPARLLHIDEEGCGLFGISVMSVEVQSDISRTETTGVPCVFPLGGRNEVSPYPYHFNESRRISWMREAHAS